MEFELETILKDLPFDGIEGDRNPRVEKCASLSEASGSDVTFCSADGELGARQISACDARVIFCKKSLKGSIHPKQEQTLVFMDDPRMAMIKVIREMNPAQQLIGISPTAVISKSAKIGSNCYIGHFSVVGDDCVIGDNTIISDRVVLAKKCRIGKRCIIQSGVSMGSDGYGFARYADLTLERFPHIAGITIGDDVEIGPNSTVARGALSDTVIGRGTKVDALVHIAHNVVIGQNCQITAGTIIAGSTKIDDDCWFGLNSTIKHKINIGKNVIIAAGACVINNVSDGDIVAGSPARSIRVKGAREVIGADKTFLMGGQE